MHSLALNKIIGYSDYGRWIHKIKALNQEYNNLYYWSRDHRDRDILKHKNLPGLVYNWRIYPYNINKEYNACYGLDKIVVNTGNWEYIPLSKNY